MCPIPGEPHDPHPPELTTSDGRKVKLKVPGLTPPVKPAAARSGGAPSRRVTIRGRLSTRTMRASSRSQSPPVWAAGRRCGGMGPITNIGRREFLAGGIGGAAALISPAWLRQALAATAVGGPGPYGELQPPDANGLQLPPGFTSRRSPAAASRSRDRVPLALRARTGRPPSGPATAAGSWSTNSEAPGGRAAAARPCSFDPEGNIEAAYRVLVGTNLNCAGGPTPWGTWLSGEEHEGGMIWEADPRGSCRRRRAPRSATSPHEAAAVDPVEGHVYLSEDQGDGLFYRFTPDSSGRPGGRPARGGRRRTPAAPSPGRRCPTRTSSRRASRPASRCPAPRSFNGGEGLWYFEGIIYFTTKGDSKVWAYDCRAQTIEVIYDGSEHARRRPQRGRQRDRLAVRRRLRLRGRRQHGDLPDHRPSARSRRSCGSPATTTATPR